LFIVKNREFFSSNSDVHNINTRSNSDLPLPKGNLTVFQKGLFYFEIRVLNEFPTTIEDLSYDVKQMKLPLKSFFFLNPFIVWWNILTGDKLRILVLYYSVLNRIFQYNIFFITTVLQIHILL